jgi:hypothetical protein
MPQSGRICGVTIGKGIQMNFSLFDDRIDALSTQLASAREEGDAEMLADELAHIIWPKREMSRKMVQVGELAHA